MFNRAALEEALNLCTSITHEGDALSGVLSELWAEAEKPESELSVVITVIWALKSRKAPIAARADAADNGVPKPLYGIGISRELIPSVDYTVSDEPECVPRVHNSEFTYMCSAIFPLVPAVLAPSTRHLTSCMKNFCSYCHVSHL